MTTSTRRLAVRTVVGLAAAALTLGVSAPVQAADDAAPRPKQLERSLDAIEATGAVGVTAEVVTPGGRWRAEAGRGELDPDRPASPQARFRAASVSKMLMTTLALQQVERGRWALSTTLDDVLPGLWPERGDTTLRQLLGHTSGIPDYLTGLIAGATSAEALREATSRPRTDAELIALAKDQPATAEPGTFSYSNTNFVLVGAMLEAETGRPLDRLVRDRVLRPAGMTRSAWPTAPGVDRPQLEEHARLEGSLLDLTTTDPTIFSGAGALVSTARDLNRFQQALSRGDLLAPRLVREMRRVTPASKAADGPFGLGSYRLPDPCRPGGFVHGHDGATFATLTMSFASPRGDRRVTVSMTGRDLDGGLESNEALIRFATTALAQACGGKPVDGAEAPSAKRLVPTSEPATVR